MSVGLVLIGRVIFSRPTEPWSGESKCLVQRMKVGKLDGRAKVIGFEQPGDSYQIKRS